MYCSNNIQFNDLIENLLKIMEKENGPKKEIPIHQKAAFQTDYERKLFYKNLNRSDEREHISLHPRKVITIYSPPKFGNLPSIHLISALSSDPESKYLTSGWQQRFVPSPGACLAYQPHRTFSAYLVYSGRVFVISDTVSPIDSVPPDHFHHPIYMEPESPLFISPYNII